MRRALLAALVMLLAPLAGCTVPDAVAEPEEDPPVVRSPAGSVRFVEPRLTEAPPAPAVTEPARDADAPPVTLDGTSSWAAAVLVHEAEYRQGQQVVERVPCDGTLLATPSGAPDPRARTQEFAYMESYQLLDEGGRAWITDRYALDGADVWASNVRGGPVAGADDGHASCAPESHGDVRYNVLLHARDVESLDVFFMTWGRPAVPDERVWGPVSPSDPGSS